MSALPWDAVPEVADDPDRALERPTAETVAWEAAMDGHARAELQGDPAFARIAEAVRRERQISGVDPPRLHGERWFHLAFSEVGWELRRAVLPADEGDAVLRSDELPAGLGLDYLYLSPGGRRVVLGLSRDGSEKSSLHVYDLEERRFLPEVIPNACFADVAWLPDESGFFYGRGRRADTFDTRQALFFHRLGEVPRDVPEPLEFSSPYIFAEVSPDGRYVIAFDTEEREIHSIRNLEDGSGWQPVEGSTGPLRQGFFDGDAYVALSHAEADRGKIARLPLATAGDHSTWDELVPEGPLVLRSLVRVGEDAMAVIGLEDGRSRVLLYTLAGRLEREPALPGAGTVALGSSILQVPLGRLAAPAREAFTFVLSAYDTAPSSYLYELPGGTLTPLGPPARTPERRLVVRRETARAADGSPIPYTIVHRHDLDTSVPQPTLVYVYGGWNVALVPSYLADLNVIVDEGAVLVLPNVRGGGELGERWWHASRRTTHDVGHADLYAVTEAIIASGLTRADAVAVAGISHGGLRACAAATQRPELFSASIALLPLADLLRFTQAPMTWTFTSEYGDPTNPVDAEALAAISPYHGLEEGKRYPAMLIAGAENDIRCPAWHGRKFAARLARSTSGPAPLFRLWPQAGHREADGGDPAHAAEWITFACRALALGESRAENAAHSGSTHPGGD